MGPPSLQELVEPSHAALVLQEMQNSVVGPDASFPALAEAARAVGLFRTLPRLADAARAVGVPVVHATAENLPAGFGANRNARLFAGARRVGADNEPGTAAVLPVAEIGVHPGDLVLPRYHGLSPLTGAQLDSLFRNRGVTTLVVAGVSLNVAIPNVVFDAVNRGYQVVVVTDGVAGVPIEYGRAVIEHTIALLATLASTDEVVTAWTSPADVD
jgi:nicotinamidase-related amidase